MKALRPSILAATAVVVFLAGTATQARDVEFKIDVAGTERVVVIRLLETIAPKTCDNFAKLCSEGFYHGVAFHRVIPNYIVQTGDPLTKDEAAVDQWGTGGPGYTVPAELGGNHVRGAVAAARLGDSENPTKASNGSQFYVALREIAPLDGQYTVFGNVISGLEAFDEIAGAPVDADNVPTVPIKIVSTRLLEAAPAALDPTPAPMKPVLPDLTTTETPDNAVSPAAPSAPAPTTPVSAAVESATTSAFSGLTELKTGEPVESKSPLMSLFDSNQAIPTPPTPPASSPAEAVTAIEPSAPDPVSVEAAPAPTEPGLSAAAVDERMPVNGENRLPAVRLQADSDALARATAAVAPMLNREDPNDGFKPLSSVGNLDNSAPAAVPAGTESAPSPPPMPEPAAPAFATRQEPEAAPLAAPSLSETPPASAAAPELAPGTEDPTAPEAAPTVPEKPKGFLGRFIRRVW